MIDRRTLIGALAGSSVAESFAAGVQPVQKSWRIGYIGVTPRGASQEGERLLEVFVRSLRESGFVEGKNMLLERRAAEGRADRAAALADELVRLRVDVLVAVGPVPIRAAKEATATIPIVMLNASDPVAGGLVASLARPGGNITGLTDFDDDLYPKRFELLKAAAPGISRLAFVENTTLLDPATAGAIAKQYDAAAQALGLSLVRIPLNAPQDFERVASAIASGHADALLVGHSAVAYLLRKELADFAIRRRLPSMVPNRTEGTGGAMLSYGPDLADIFRKAAAYVAKILNGAKPADLPVERPTKVELVINLKTARAIGLTIPQSLLLRADETIQ